MIEFIFIVINVLLGLWSYDRAEMEWFAFNCAATAWFLRGFLETAKRQEDEE